MIDRDTRKKFLKIKLTESLKESIYSIQTVFSGKKKLGDIIRERKARNMIRRT